MSWTNRRRTPPDSALFCSVTKTSHQGADPADCCRRGGAVLPPGSGRPGLERRQWAIASRTDSLALVATREQVSIDLDAEVAAILRAHAAEARLSEGEIVDRAIRAYDVRSLIARVRERSDLDEEDAMALVREELRAARAERHKAA
jgi:hypothetical protein